MSDINIEQLKEYIDNEQWDQARSMLEGFFRINLAEEPDATSMLRQTSAYLEAVNSLNREHLAVLDNALAMLKDIDEQQSQEETEIDLEATRSQLRNS